MKARKILLLVLVLGFGVGVETASQLGGRWIGPWACRLGDKFIGPSFGFESHADREVTDATTVEVENSFGTVRVTTGAPHTARVTLRSVVYLPTEEKAGAFAARIHPDLRPTGSALRILTNRKELESAGFRDVGFETNLDVEVPPGTAVKVRNEHGAVDVTDVASAEIVNAFEAVRAERVAGALTLTSAHGDVAVSGVKGPLTLTSHHGDVEIKDVAGRLTVTAEHGDVSVERAGGGSVTLHHGDLKVRSLEGDLDVKGEHAGVDASGITGRLGLETTFRDVDVTSVGRDARIKTAHGKVNAKEIAGSLTVEVSFDDVTLDAVHGPAEVTVTHGALHARGLQAGARIIALGDDVVLDGFKGPVTVNATRASVELSPTGPLTEPLTVTTANGGIRLEIPEGSRFDLDVSVRRGDLEFSDIPGLASTESVGARRLVGKVGGGGNRVILAAEHGDVKVTGLPRQASK